VAFCNTIVDRRMDVTVQNYLSETNVTWSRTWRAPRLASVHRNGGRRDACDPDAMKDGKMSSCGDCWRRQRAVWPVRLSDAACSRYRCIVQIVTPVCRLPGRTDTIHKAVSSRPDCSLALSDAVQAVHRRDATSPLLSLDSAADTDISGFGR